MKQNSKEKYWREVRKQDYIQVMDADTKLLIKLLDIARGKKSMEKFLHDNGLNVSCISNMVYGGMRHLHVKDIFMIVQNLPDKSPVTEELLLAADGLYKKGPSPVSDEEMERSIIQIRKKIRLLADPVKKTKMGHGQKREPLKSETPKANVVKRADIVDFPSGYKNYEAFIDDLCFYGKRKPEDVLLFLKKKQKQLFSDKSFCRVLSMYRKYATAEKEQRVSELQAFYLSGTDPQECVSLAQRYNIILDGFVKEAMKGEQ